jgi:catalase
MNSVDTICQIAGLSAVIALAIAPPGTAHARDSAAPPLNSTPVQLVDALNGVFGRHSEARAIHAKGVVLEGDFTPSSAASSISKAAHMQSTVVPVTVRFSNFAGIPTQPDNDSGANPRGFAVKFHLPDGGQSDILAISFNGFPSATADDFRELLIALGTSGTGAAKPTPLDTYLASHAAAKAFLTAPKPAPMSFATTPYFAVNTFKFTNAAGVVTYGRYQFLPVSGAHYLSDDQAANASSDYLQDEIPRRIKNGPVLFKLVLQVAEQGDRLDNPSIVWPDTRRTVELGVLKIARAIADTDAASRDLLFIPGAVPDGITPADPMIADRSPAYVVSYGRRHE